jgi:hypothetical protein
MTCLKFNIITELRKTLAGQSSKVHPLTLLHAIGPQYLLQFEEERKNDRQQANT